MANKSPKSETTIALAADFRLRRMILGWPKVILLSAITVALLTTAQEPIGYSYTAWLALVPWVLAVAGAKTGGKALLINLLVGLAYFLVNAYWLTWVTPLGYLAVSFYLGWYFVLTGFILRQIYLYRRWPFTLVLPVIWVGQEFLRATVITGFPWSFLSHTQHHSLRLIQISDTLGAYGVTFLVGMTNGLICDLLLRPLVKRKTPSSQQNNDDEAGASAKQSPVIVNPRLVARELILITAACLIGAGLYGYWRLRQSAQTITTGPTLALIQENIPQYVKESGKSNLEIFGRHLKLSQQALAAQPKPDLIVWPETMTCVPVNDEFLELQAPGFDLSGFEYLSQARDFDRQLRELAKQGSAVLVGTPGLEMAPVGNELLPVNKWNSAVLYLKTGQKSPKRYDKMHLVPFGEVVPFKNSWPWLYRQLNSLTPYDYEYSLDAGQEETVFQFTDSIGRPWQFAVAICYEDATAYVPRKLTTAGGQKKIDFLLNISNDGWFVHGGLDNQPILPSSELAQHWAICKFRAVENRIGIARAVNTGISGFIRPDGSEQTTPLAGTLAGNIYSRQATAGFITDKITLDSRVSPYSRIGDLFAIVCTFITAVLFLVAFHCRKKTTDKLQKRKTKKR
ncbi:MAG: apolipoprotein N-acyltransferase [Sedimentisphaerales bacterium]|nr:apolipoprotein N-acyltransferase [Sedimentisphaerales bacterium]